MHGLKGGSWKRSVGHGHRSWAPGGNRGDERRAYRHHTSPRQLPTRLRRANVRRLFNRLNMWIVRRIWGWRFKRWRNAGWRSLPETRLYGEYGLVNLLQLIPSMRDYYRRKGYTH